MNKRIGSSATSGMKIVETSALCLLLLFFIGASFGLVALGAKVYKQIEKDARGNFESRTPLSYLTMKIRQNDRVGGVQIRNLEGQEALVLLEEVEGVKYETWIYSYDEALREVYIEAGDKMSLENGMPIMPLRDLKVHRDEKRLVSIVIEDLAGHKAETSVALRSGGYDE